MKRSLPFGLSECQVCHKVFRTAQLGPLETGGIVARRWDERPKTGGPGVPNRGLDSGKGRLGAFPQWKACRVPEVVRACESCGGHIAPEVVPVKTWVAANEAWASWKTLDGGGDWGKFAPKKFRK